MAKPIAPLYQGGNPSFPLSYSATTPYNSRVESQELAWSAGDTESPKNYQFVGFRPGFPLQASELNEIQEHFQMQLTLSMSMMHNWICSGAGPTWWGWNDQYPGDGSGVELPTDDVPNTGVGVGGGVGGGGHEQMNAISGPGWRGATPLHPFASPYRQQANATSSPSVEFEKLNNELKITINPGWWFVEVRGYNDGSSSVGHISGLKHWIYVNEPYDTTIAVGDGGDVDIPVGFELQSKYYRCCDTSDDSEENPCDPNLGDNAAGFANSVACGASRYAIDAIGVNHPTNWPTDGDWSASAITEYENLSLICKVNPVQRTVRYMNNLLIGQFTQ
jgi:hypothetical protein